MEKLTLLQRVQPEPNVALQEAAIEEEDDFPPLTWGRPLKRKRQQLSDLQGRVRTVGAHDVFRYQQIQCQVQGKEGIPSLNHVRLGSRKVVNI